MRTSIKALLLFALALVASSQPYEHPFTEFAKRVPAMAEMVDPTISINVNITSFNVNGEYVNVSWSGIPNPSGNDVIALYSPASADVKKKIPVQIMNASYTTPSYVRSGSGWTVFKLINMRQSFIFKLIQNEADYDPVVASAVVVAQSPVILNNIPSQPLGGHLTVHKDAKSMVLQWTSGSSSTQYVEYGAPGELLSGLSSSTAELMYTEKDMCGGIATGLGYKHPGYLHTVVIPVGAFSPNSAVSYRFGSKTVGWSGPYSFLIPPRTGVRSDPNLKFLVFVDVGQTNTVAFYDYPGSEYPPGLSLDYNYAINSAKLPFYLAREAAHVALLPGDIAYAVGFVADWDFFTNQFEPAFTQFPVAFGLGNHERDWPYTGDAFNNTSHDSGGECGVAALKRFYTPGNRRAFKNMIGKAPAALFYSFERGPVHFIMLDSEMPSSVGTDQHNFVKKDLASVDRNITPWVVVTFHRMMVAPATYSAPYVGDLQVEARLQEDYQDLFMKYKVNMVISGHEHAYARTCMFYNYTCVNATNPAPDGSTTAPVYMMAGTGGAHFTHGFPVPLPNWVESGFQFKNGYLRSEANYTHLVMQFVSDDTGLVNDYVVLQQ
jgi:hypothetical protein